METKKIIPSHVGHDHSAIVPRWSGVEKRPMDIGIELDKKRREEAKPLLVPLHLNSLSSERELNMALQARADLAQRMFELNPRGFRMHKDGSVPFLEAAFAAAGGTKVEPPAQSKRSKNKRRDKGLFLIRCKDNPKQNWSNWQRNHNGQTRADTLASRA